MNPFMKSYSIKSFDMKPLSVVTNIITGLMIIYTMSETTSSSAMAERPRDEVKW